MHTMYLVNVEMDIFGHQATVTQFNRNIRQIFRLPFVLYVCLARRQAAVLI